MKNVVKILLPAISVLFLWASPCAKAQNAFPQNGYVPPYNQSTITNETAGSAITFNTSTYCPAPPVGSVLPTVTLYISTDPNSVGTNQGTVTVGDGASIAYVFNQAGTYYVSMYLTVNGDTGCYGPGQLMETTTPQVTTVTVINTDRK